MRVLDSCTTIFRMKEPDWTVKVWNQEAAGQEFLLVKQVLPTLSRY